MSMDLIQFQTALTMLNQGLGKTREELGTALTDDEMTFKERSDILAAGERKLLEFDALISQVDDDMREMAMARSGKEIAKIRDRVANLKEKI